jgi:hypothetical protein
LDGEIVGVGAGLPVHSAGVFFTRRIGYSTDTAPHSCRLLAINPYFALIGQLNLLDQGFTFPRVAVFSL